MKYLLPIFLFFSTALVAQKKIIDHTAYNGWKRVADVKVSDNGKFTVYTIKPHRGDGYLYIVNNLTGKKDSIFRGVNPVFAGDDSFVAFKITPGFDTLRNSELNKVKKDKWPKDSLGVYLFANDSLIRIPKVKSFYVAEEGNWILYLNDGNTLPAGKKKKKGIFSFLKKKEVEKKYESEGNVMVFFTPGTTKKKHTKDVKRVFLPEKGNYYAYLIHQKEKKADSLQVCIGNGENTAAWKVPQKFNDVSDLQFNYKGTEIVFTASMDTSEKKSYQLFHADLVNQKFTKLIDTVQTGLPEGFRVSDNYAPSFSRNGNRIFFGVAPKPEVTPKDTLLENEKAKLDVWHWKDDRLQPQQLLEREDDEKSTHLAAYDLTSKDFAISGSDTLHVMIQNHGDSDFALAYSIKPYQHAYNWEYPNKTDFYRINLKTGKAELLKREVTNNVSLSPSGAYFVYFNAANTEQYLLDINTGKESCITCGTKATWLDDVNGMPMIPEPFGIAGWIRGERELLLRSKYDVWSYNISYNKLTALTNGESRKLRYNLREWDSDSVYIHFDNTYLLGFDESDKSASLYQPKWENNALTLDMKFKTAHDVVGVKKARQSGEYVFQRSSVKDYPDVHLGNWNETGSTEQISLANPQQSEYNWATVELISWKSYEGIPLQGLLYKPENYDSTKQYPLLVYFYEMYSDELHTHYAPRPTASIIFPTEYASAGYFVLIPDIRYKPGYPARGAYDCIMSGTDYVLRKYKSVDSTRMGLQGQSWGGYQTAQLVTMTTRYKAAMAGAPVGNMFSAYGGIRWGSGLNRQFQYERTQSRIGKTIWEAPELYVENSPLFHLPKVQTPLLIMHNDGDGAVPWYQGIEIFTGMKRLNKPVWLLNYNGDDHNLMKNANRIDLSIRMRQFFDFYLMGKPAPKWLKEGVPAVDKGKKYGLD